MSIPALFFAFNAWGDSLVVAGIALHTMAWLAMSSPDRSNHGATGNLLTAFIQTPFRLIRGFELASPATDQAMGCSARCILHIRKTLPTHK
ncbi:hypothetical protein BOW22_10625 [Solemya velum gill symbiont]|nr:hypothetical protein BOW19_10630 [Solemya velum gill symbiont]OOZ02065.1 hypothetical protein BOW21_10710 [Solemya velum gill symbiont]OOZ04096.1 hypothetical protein BOW22_10625 [Solemya velum gill symbiont]OOZ06338.1 hypothetical protein BOW23_10630 [Solemya velum gill symbiont]OOZ08677.1 hypothetical protein BOW24_10670 [Solemya velum gill symbiont]